MNKWKMSFLSAALVLSMAIPTLANAEVRKPPADGFTKTSTTPPTRPGIPVEFQKFLQELHAKLAKGEITREQYNRMLLDWIKEHSTNPKDKK
ncbi:hypothetical protein [Brevibacillus sp. SYSU BS000544]|uniref:hypothetical protein n=1 Tax=Brevibacillus sp. SYSU BS000544 TaxID=3416443 RepID=UPI003CE4FFDD